MVGGRKNRGKEKTLEGLLFSSELMFECLRKIRQVFFFFFPGFRDRVSLCSPGCPGTHSVDQAAASASQVLGLKVYDTTAKLTRQFYYRAARGVKAGKGTSCSGRTVTPRSAH